MTREEFNKLPVYPKIALHVSPTTYGNKVEAVSWVDKDGYAIKSVYSRGDKGYFPSIETVEDVIGMCKEHIPYMQENIVVNPEEVDMQGTPIFQKIH